MRFLLFVLVSSFSFSLFAQDTVVFGEVGATSAVGVSLNVEQKVAGPFAIQAGLGLTPHRYGGTPGVIIPLRLSVTLGSSRIRPEVSLSVLLVPDRVVRVAMDKMLKAMRTDLGHGTLGLRERELSSSFLQDLGSAIQKGDAERRAETEATADSDASGEPAEEEE